MVKEFLIGIDLGTSGTKSALYRIDGTLTAESYAEVQLYHPKPGVVEQDMEDFYRSAAKTVKACITQSGIDPKKVAAIAFDSQMAGVGAIEENFNPVTRFDSWLDMRCQPYIEFMSDKAKREITKLTGCPPTCNHGPKMLWWQNEEPEIYNRIIKFLMPAAYVVGRLAGLTPEQTFIDYTYLHFTGFAESESGTWSSELCQKFGLKMEKLPKIVSPWEIVGEVKSDCAKDFGLAPGTLIAAGAGDTAANALGAGIVEPGILFDVAGTASVLAGCTDSYVADTNNFALITMRSVIPGLWNPLAYIGGGGIVLRWLRDNIYQESKLSQTDSKPAEKYDAMIALAGKVEAGSEGLMFSPHFGGRICPSNPEMRGAWIGLSWSHHQQHMIRSMLESVAYEYAYYLQIMCDLVPDQNYFEARGMGGGAKSTIWNQIKADVLNVDYYRLKGNEFGTWGSAMIAGKAAGLINDLASHAAEHAKLTDHPLKVNSNIHQIYKPFVDKYIEMESILNNFYK